MRNDTTYVARSGILGTPISGNLVNCTGYAVNQLSGLGAGVSGAMAINTGSTGSVVVNGGNLGTPSGGDASNLTNFPSTLATTALTSAHINIGDGTNTAFPRALSGDVTVNNLGVTTISNNAVTNDKIANATIDLTTKVTGILPTANGG
ncbi:hypothetical protein, partial [Acinetobacter baumannii]|uniref:hypothetical protein n=1 Tax=Acinetobacter baumannii TaxID=470 RepID=UPI003461DD49